MPAAQSNLQVSSRMRVPVAAGPEQRAKARILATVALVCSILNFHLPEVLPVGLPAAGAEVEMAGPEREGAEVAVRVKTEHRLLQEALQVSLIRAAAAAGAG